MNQQEDTILIKQFLNGDASAFKKIAIKYNPMVYTLAYRVLKNREEAEELTQDVFIKVFKSLKTFNNKSKLSTWIYRITYNTSINKLKSQKRRVETTLIDDSTEFCNTSQPDASNIITEKENKKIINDSILKLPEIDRIIITLYYYEELSVKEIAEVTELTLQNIKVRLFRSRQRLFDILKDVIK